MKCDQVIEKIKTRVGNIDPNGPRKVLGVFLLSIKAADGQHDLSKDLICVYFYFYFFFRVLCTVQSSVTDLLIKFLFYCVAVDLKNLKVSDGKTGTPDTTLEVDDETFLAIGTKSMTMADAIAAGKVKVGGNTQLASSLAEVL